MRWLNATKIRRRDIVLPPGLCDARLCRQRNHPSVAGCVQRAARTDFDKEMA